MSWGKKGRSEEREEEKERKAGSEEGREGGKFAKASSHITSGPAWSTEALLSATANLLTSHILMQTTGLEKLPSKHDNLVRS